jgi:hypothetical protein
MLKSDFLAFLARTFMKVPELSNFTVMSVNVRSSIFHVNVSFVFVNDLNEREYCLKILK